MEKSAVVHARLEPAAKRKAEGVLRQLGMTPTEAIRLFYRQISLRGGLPFAVQIPNKATKEALRKSRAGEEIERFENLEDMSTGWKK